MSESQLSTIPDRQYIEEKPNNSSTLNNIMDTQKSIISWLINRWKNDWIIQDYIKLFSDLENMEIMSLVFYIKWIWLQIKVKKIKYSKIHWLFMFNLDDSPWKIWLLNKYIKEDFFIDLWNKYIIKWKISIVNWWISFMTNDILINRANRIKLFSKENVLEYPFKEDNEYIPKDEFPLKAYIGNMDNTNFWFIWNISEGWMLLYINDTLMNWTTDNYVFKIIDDTNSNKEWVPIYIRFNGKQIMVNIKKIHFNKDLWFKHYWFLCRIWCSFTNINPELKAIIDEFTYKITAINLKDSKCDIKDCEWKVCNNCSKRY